MVLLLSWLPTLLHLGLLLLLLMLLLCLLGVQEMIMIMSMSVKMTGSYMYKESHSLFFLTQFQPIFSSPSLSLGVFLANMIFHLTTWGFFLEDIYLPMNHNQ